MGCTVGETPSTGDILDRRRALRPKLDLGSRVVWKPGWRLNRGWVLKDDLDSDSREVLRSRWRAQRVEPFFGLRELPASIREKLPPEYLSLAEAFGGAEGFLGDLYLRLYRVREIAEANHAYDVSSWFPGCLLFGSNGGGEAVGFLVKTGQVVKVPFIPLAEEFAEVLGDTFQDFICRTAASGVSSELNPQALGLEVHEIHLIVFGGDPVDPTNKVLLQPVKHSELCRYWNRMYRNSKPKV